ncbi:MAG: hypothetical protein IJ268_04810 [Proteobacteria bacterium]|nr:hypothetical protein [Pseudomonadota bacterium]MBQ9242210.1 hypothetical protein [Pseudomonadota bacterium]
MIFTPKQPIAAENGIRITEYGKPNPIGPNAYFFADVLEELIFHAQKHEARGILLGNAFLLPETAAQNLLEAQKTNSFPLGLNIPNYLEVVAFRDIYPTANALDYASYLRRIRDFKTPRGQHLILGQVILSPEPRQPVLEDLMLQRTYFCEPWQMTVYISAAHTTPKVFMLNEAGESWYETGFKLVSSDVSPLELS